MAEPEKKFPGLLHPLSMMRRTRGLPNLEYQVIESTDLPEPYRQLLAHEGDMTSRLESAYRASICLLYTSPSPRDKRQSRMPSSA